MNKCKLLKPMLSCLLLFLFIQCSKNKEEKDSYTFYSTEWLKSSPKVNVNKKDLPEWLVKRINEYDKFVAPVDCIKFFRGNWNNETVYYIYSVLNSCIFCELYYENGNKVELYFSEDPDLSDKLSNDFFEKSKSWVILYEFGSCY